MQIKSTVREIEQPDAVPIFDETIQEKRWTDESELMCWLSITVKTEPSRG